MPTKEERRIEAIDRLGMLTGKGLMPCVKRDFENDGTVYYSEYNGMCGALYYLNDLGGAKQEWIDLVKEFEETYDATVYHVSHDYTNFGELLDLFFVSKYDEEWEYEREDLVDGYAYCHVCNLSEPTFSEPGTIAYRIVGGGVVRVG